MDSKLEYFAHLMDLLRTSNGLKETALVRDEPDDASIYRKLTTWIRAGFSGMNSYFWNTIKGVAVHLVQRHIKEQLIGIHREWPIAGGMLGFLAFGVLLAVAGYGVHWNLPDCGRIEAVLTDIFEESTLPVAWAVLGFYGFGVWGAVPGFAVTWMLCNYGRIMAVLTGNNEGVPWSIPGSLLGCCAFSICTAVAELVAKWTPSNHGRIMAVLTDILKAVVLPTLGGILGGILGFCVFPIWEAVAGNHEGSPSSIAGSLHGFYAFDIWGAVAGFAVTWILCNYGRIMAVLTDILKAVVLPIVGGILGFYVFAIWGAVAGSLLFCKKVDKYTSMVAALTGLTENEKNDLVSKIRELVGSPRTENLTGFISSLPHRKSLLRILFDYTKQRVTVREVMRWCVYVCLCVLTVHKSSLIKMTAGWGGGTST